MSQKLPANNFELIKGTSRFNEDFMKNYNEDSDEWYSLEIEVQYLEKLHELQNNLPFLHEQSDEGILLWLKFIIIFIKTLKKMLKQGLILQILN